MTRSGSSPDRSVGMALALTGFGFLELIGVLTVVISAVDAWADAWWGFAGTAVVMVPLGAMMAVEGIRRRRWAGKADSMVEPVEGTLHVTGGTSDKYDNTVFASCEITGVLTAPGMVPTGSATVTGIPVSDRTSSTVNPGAISNEVTLSKKAAPGRPDEINHGYQDLDDGRLRACW